METTCKPGGEHLANETRSNAKDTELLRAWQAGDQEAGAALYERHYDAVDRFFRNKVTDPEDLIQTTFMACLESLGRFEGRSRFRTYLIGISYNRLLKHYKAKSRLANHTSLDGLSVETMGQTPSQILVIGDNHRWLLEALRRLPLHLQITMELRFWETMSQREISDVLDKPIGTVKEWIRRGKQLLRKSMAEMEVSGESLHTTVTKLDDWASQMRQKLREGDEDG